MDQLSLFTIGFIFALVFLTIFSYTMCLLSICWLGEKKTVLTVPGGFISNDSNEALETISMSTDVMKIMSQNYVDLTLV